MEYTGLCLGASTISLVTIQQERDRIKIVDAIRKPHEGEPNRVLLQLLSRKKHFRLCATGRKFRHLLKVPSISESEAVEMAYAFSYKGKAVDGIISAGGETFILYELNNNGTIGNVYTGSKCASGTGEFFLQQVRRMGLKIEKALEISAGAEPYPVAGRCSVFCKSDCTHALNKGEKKERVLAGLCKMMATKILELVNKTRVRRALLIGGTSLNSIMVEFLKTELEIVIPPEAPYFEALGAALWAQKHNVEPVNIDSDNLFRNNKSSFTFLPPLKEARHLVSFKDTYRDKAKAGDSLFLGLDVGSTTTKAVLLREEDMAIVASTYLRTQGDPVEATKKCYLDLARQLPPGVNIIGLGVTGSGRQIAGLHALTPAVINEIIAHATAAVYFDPNVDTIFEIGGQDAKYTYIINGVPADYAMNEACSAGTGSFLEEAAKEFLEIELNRVASLALKAKSPPNFNDQCAAFIGSDIKTAVQEGIAGADIIGGLVYSICHNYLTRVKGNRPVGNKIFMQGGVCYNRAVPIAMAALLEKEIVVPPEPGLMGAFGVALDVMKKVRKGQLSPCRYDLNELSSRNIEYDKPFTCKGNERCDRGCTIKVLKIKEKRYPFGGACSRYSGVKRSKSRHTGALDLVLARERAIFNGESNVKRQSDNMLSPNGNKSIGISRSLLVNNLFPLYSNFFKSLGYNVITPTRALPSGQARQGASFCYPVELAHGLMEDLLRHEPDFVFLPQVKGLPPAGRDIVSVTCPLVQGEPYYLQAAFPLLQEMKDKGRLLTPVLDFSDGYKAREKEFVSLGMALGASRLESKAAYQLAVSSQEKFMKDLKQQGSKLLEELAANPEKKALVLFGRSYNAFSALANMSIPHKFASRGWKIIPCDSLPFAEEESFENMYWYSGQMILQAARLVRKHPQLFGVYITNFSCGPDSFLVGYFREIMENKPSLTLELDSHTSDGGIDTRIEAFLDIINSYLEVTSKAKIAGSKKVNKNSRAKAVVQKGQVFIHLPSGDQLPLEHPRVKLLIPAMGKENARFVSAVLKERGIRNQFLPQPGKKELKLGQANSNCKECLPLQLTVGSLLRYLEENPSPPEEQLVYFMPDTSGPCRFGQYQVFINRLLDRMALNHVTTLSLSSDNSYGGLGLRFTAKAWLAIIIGDVFSDIYSALLALSRDKEEAMEVYDKACQLVISSLERGRWNEIRKTLQLVAHQFGKLQLEQPLEKAPKVALLGEIYVRSDSFSRQNLVESLASHGIVTKIAPINEWIYYLDFLLQKGILKQSTIKDRWKNRLQMPLKRWIEKDVKQILSASGLYHFSLTNVETLIDAGKKFISPHLTGEAILTVGGALAEIINEVDGVIAIGPFGCMPNRIAEAVAGSALAHGDLPAGCGKLAHRILARHPHLPFMAVETDGNIFPQVVVARLESFVLQVKRLYRLIREEKMLVQHANSRVAQERFWAYNKELKVNNLSNLGKEP